MSMQPFGWCLVDLSPDTWLGFGCHSSAMEDSECKRVVRAFRQQSQKTANSTVGSPRDYARPNEILPLSDSLPYASQQRYAPFLLPVLIAPTLICTSRNQKSCRRHGCLQSPVTQAVAAVDSPYRLNHGHTHLTAGCRLCQLIAFDRRIRHHPRLAAHVFARG